MTQVLELGWFAAQCIDCGDDLGGREDDICEECRGNVIRANRTMRPPVELAQNPIVFVKGISYETPSP